MKYENTSKTARVNRPHRTQVEMQLLALDQLLPDDHRARTVWAFVTSLNLEPFYRDIEVADNVPGRTAIAPEVLIALWLLATLDGIGSARAGQAMRIRHPLSLDARGSASELSHAE